MHPLFFILTVLVFFAVVLTTYVLIQIYLAKYHHESRYYWRRSTLLSSMVLYLTHNILVDLMMGALRIWAVTHFTMKQWLSAFSHIFLLFRLKKALNHLHRGADMSLIKDMLTHGSLESDIQPTRFLNQFLHHYGLTNINDLVEKKLISQAELDLFAHVLALKLYRQIHMAQDYVLATAPSKRVQLREDIALENIELAGCSRAFLIHLIKQNRAISAIISSPETNELTYKTLMKIYPKATKTGELLQIMHDTLEFRFDFAQEKTSNTLSRNYFLAQLDKKQVLEQIQVPLEHLPNRIVNFYELPVDIHPVYLSIQRQFAQEAFKLNPLAGWIYNLSWEYEYRVGFS